MKISYSLAFFVLILLVVAAVFVWLEGDNQNSPTLRRLVNCRSEILDDSVLDLSADTTLIGAFITFDQMPLSAETKDSLNKLSVVIDEGSQIFEISSNVLAQIPTASLCALSEMKSVKSIFIPAPSGESSDSNSNDAP